MCDNLTELDLPSLRICNGFHSCSQLSSLRLPNLVEIGSDGFENCTRLSELHLPSLVKCEGFKGCSDLKRLDAPNLEEV